MSRAGGCGTSQGKRGGGGQKVGRAGRRTDLDQSEADAEHSIDRLRCRRTRREGAHSLSGGTHANTQTQTEQGKGGRRASARAHLGVLVEASREADRVAHLAAPQGHLRRGRGRPEPKQRMREVARPNAVPGLTRRRLRRSEARARSSRRTLRPCALTLLLALPASAHFRRALLVEVSLRLCVRVVSEMKKAHRALLA